MTNDAGGSRPPSNLPECECFQTEDAYTWGRCGDAARVSNALCGEFMSRANSENLCATALPYLLDITVIGLLCYIAKTQGPALEYGSEDIERESERLLLGLEARVLARQRETYARSRALGLTEASVTAMRQGRRETSQ